MTLYRDTSGVVIIIFALLLPIIVGFVGLGIESAFWFSQKRSLQTMADAAAIGGVYEVAASGTGAGTILTKSTLDATQNGYDSGSGDTIAVSNPPIIGSYTTDNAAVEVRLTRTINFLFVGLIMPQNSFVLGARAVASSVPIGDACILTLSPSADNSFKIPGAINMDMDCGIAVTSNSSLGASFAGNSHCRKR